MTGSASLYVDYAATAPMRREVLEAMWPWLTSHFANPSSRYEAGREARQALEQARGQLAQMLGCLSGELIFTSGGTEADNLAIKGLALAAQRPPEHRRILISPLEHAAVEGACAYLERYHGFTIERLQVDSNGHVDLDDLDQRLQRPATLVSVLWAHNEIGTIQRIAAIAERVAKSDALLHVDAVQAAGWLAIDLSQLMIDALTISGHKLGAGRGIGALYVRRGVPLEPLIHGGSQEKGRRGGTEALPQAIGLVKAYELARRDAETHSKAVADRRDRLIEGVLARCAGARLTGDPSERLPHHVSFVFPGIHGEAVLLALEARGILCSSGSACKAGDDAPSPSLLALGIEASEAQTALRLCLSVTNTEADIDRLINAVATAVDEVNALGQP
ncbi:cysteine desulfurase family protein [Carnimonas bestiolae]|uniref:cysteine desulfurase family protein n=1 Tax=Carnimonas bestiolae TaxID=3402172 RepID=UPI003EDBDA5B